MDSWYIRAGRAYDDWTVRAATWLIWTVGLMGVVTCIVLLVMLAMNV